jgi:hypothetical protein
MWAMLPICIKSQRDNQFVSAVGYLYPAVCFFQALWTFTFSYEIIWASFLSMVMIFLTLWLAVWRLAKQDSPYKGSLANYVLWRLPFTIHAGWITAATFVNANVLLVDWQVSTTLQYYASLISLFLLLLIAFVTTVGLDLIIPLVISWALFGVHAELVEPKESISARFNGNQLELAQWGSLSFSILIAVGVLVGLFYQVFFKKQHPSRRNATQTESVYYRDE